MSKKIIKKIFRKVRNANLRYNLIEDNDKVAVAISGGKDSICLLYFLALLKKYTPLDFEIIPIYIDLGFGNDLEGINSVINQMGFQLIVEESNIAEIVFDVRQEKNPCSLCSKMRRGAINKIAKDYNCNKIALGHHLDDVVQTLFMSMLFEGRYNVFKPNTYLDRIDIRAIRPLIYVEEKEVEAFIKQSGFLPIKNLCPADGKTKRQEMKELIDDINIKYPDAKLNILKSIENVAADVFWK